MTDNVNHPSHYANGWSNGAEVIDITENLNFNRGNAVKYIARAGKKNPDAEIEDLRKAKWYLDRELTRLLNAPESNSDEVSEDSGVPTWVPKLTEAEKDSEWVTDLLHYRWRDGAWRCTSVDNVSRTCYWPVERWGVAHDSLLTLRGGYFRCIRAS